MNKLEKSCSMKVNDIKTNSALKEKKEPVRTFFFLLFSFNETTSNLIFAFF